LERKIFNRVDYFIFDCLIIFNFFVKEKPIPKKLIKNKINKLSSNNNHILRSVFFRIQWKLISDMLSNTFISKFFYFERRNQLNKVKVKIDFKCFSQSLHDFKVFYLCLLLK
jgi:hypothetical protein